MQLILFKSYTTMAEDLELSADENMPSCSFNLRVIKDKNNKRKFETHYVEDFPKYENLQEMKKALIKKFSSAFCGEIPTTIDLGFIGYSNKKFPIDSSTDLAKAFESGSLHASKIPVFYMVEGSETESDPEEKGTDSHFAVPCV